MKWWFLACFNGYGQKSAQQVGTVGIGNAVVAATVNSRQQAATEDAIGTLTLDPAADATSAGSGTTSVQARQGSGYARANPSNTLSGNPPTYADQQETPVPRLSLDCGVGAGPGEPARPQLATQADVPNLTIPRLFSDVGTSRSRVPSIDVPASEGVSSSAQSEASSGALVVRGGRAAALLGLGPGDSSASRQLVSRVLSGRASLDALLMFGALVRAADEAGMAVAGLGPSPRLERIESGDLPAGEDRDRDLTAHHLSHSHLQPSAPPPQQQQQQQDHEREGEGKLTLPPQQQPRSAAGKGGGGGSAAVAAAAAAAAFRSASPTNTPRAAAAATNLIGNDVDGARPAPQAAPSVQPAPRLGRRGGSMLRWGAGPGSLMQSQGHASLAAAFNSTGGSSITSTAQPAAADNDFTFSPPTVTGSHRLISTDNSRALHSDALLAAQQAAADAQVFDLFMRLVTNTSTNNTGEMELGSSASGGAPSGAGTAGLRLMAPTIGLAPPGTGAAARRRTMERSFSEKASRKYSNRHGAAGGGGGGVGRRLGSGLTAGSTLTGGRGHVGRHAARLGRLGEGDPGSGGGGGGSGSAGGGGGDEAAGGSAPLLTLPAKLSAYRRASWDAIPPPQSALAMAAAAFAVAGLLRPSASSNTGGLGGAGSLHSTGSRLGGSGSRFWPMGNTLCDDSGPASLLLMGALSGQLSMVGNSAASLVRLPTGSGSVRDVLSRIQQQQYLQQQHNQNEGPNAPSSSSWSTHTGLASLFDVHLTAALRRTGAVRTFKRAVCGGGAVALSLSRASSSVGSQPTDPLAHQGTSMTFTGGLVQLQLGRTSSSPDHPPGLHSGDGGVSQLGAAAAGDTGVIVGGVQPHVRRANLSSISTIHSIQEGSSTSTIARAEGNLNNAHANGNCNGPARTGDGGPLLGCGANGPFVGALVVEGGNRTSTDACRGPADLGAGAAAAAAAGSGFGSPRLHPQRPSGSCAGGDAHPSAAPRLPMHEQLLWFVERQQQRHSAARLQREQPGPPPAGGVAAEHGSRGSGSGASDGSKHKQRPPHHLHPQSHPHLQHYPHTEAAADGAPGPPGIPSGQHGDERGSLSLALGVLTRPGAAQARPSAADGSINGALIQRSGLGPAGSNAYSGFLLVGPGGPAGSPGPQPPPPLGAVGPTWLEPQPALPLPGFAPLHGHARRGVAGSGMEGMGAGLAQSASLDFSRYSWETEWGPAEPARGADAADDTFTFTGRSSFSQGART